MLCRDSEEPACRVGMLPDDSTEQSPGTLAGKLSRSKEGMARVFAVRVQILMSITRVAPRPGEAERSRGYNLSRSQKSITVQDLDCGQVRVSGFKMLNKFVLPAEQVMMIKD